MRPLVILAVCMLSPAWAGDLPQALQAKLLSVIVKGSPPPHRALVKDFQLRLELQKLGVSHDEGAPLAWAASEGDVKAFKTAGKLVVCGRVEWLAAGGTVALVDEGGRPQIYLHVGHLSASGFSLPDAIMKAAKKL